MVVKRQQSSPLITWPALQLLDYIIFLPKEPIELCDFVIEERLVLCEADLDEAPDEFFARQAPELFARNPRDGRS